MISAIIDMIQRVKLFTHEVLVHTRLEAVENLLSRVVPYEISLNSRGSIQFDTLKKDQSDKDKLGHAVMILQGDQRQPSA